MSDNEGSGSEKDEKEKTAPSGKKFVIKKWHAVTLWTWGAPVALPVA